MIRTVWGCVGVGGCAVVLAAGCDGGGAGTATPLPAPTRVERQVSQAPQRAVTSAVEAGEPEVSWDTERDHEFARLLKKSSGGMIRKAAVGIENHGVLKVEISKAVDPEDTLPLTKSLIAGARKDMPDSPFILSLFDPEGGAILRARYRPGKGVEYKIAHGGHNGQPGAAPARPTYDKPTAKPAPMPGDDDPIARGGVTTLDSEFASWAEGHSNGMLRYVESDLEKHGRLWMGVTQEVKPADVKPLTESLLKGARTKFPRGDLVATVFDPDGERIGKATLGSGGEVRWDK